MPEVLADEDARPPAMLGAIPKRRIERSESIPGGQVALLVEEAVGREVDLAVDVDDLAGADVQRGVVEPMPGALEDQAGHDVDAARSRRIAKRVDLRRSEAVRDVRHLVLEEVPGEREFGKDDQGGTGRGRARDDREMGPKVRCDIPEPRIELGERDADRAGGIGAGFAQRQRVVNRRPGWDRRHRYHAGSRSFEDHWADSPTVSGNVPEFTNASTIAGT